MQATIHHITTYNNIVGAVLRSRREQLGLEQAEMAKKVGLTQPSYSRIESGKTSLTLLQLNEFAPHFKLTAPNFIAHVEKIKTDMVRQGINVSPKKAPNIGEGVTNLLIGGALLAIVAQMMKK